MIKQDKGWPFVVAVSDSYDLECTVKDIFGTQLKDQIINSGKLNTNQGGALRYCEMLINITSSGSVILVPPDSGDLSTVISDTIDALFTKFGSTTNSKGYKVLPDYIRVAQGDGLTIESLKQIYAEVDR